MRQQSKRQAEVPASGVNRARRRGVWLLGFIALVVAPVGLSPAEARDRDQESLPPAIFFERPDEPTETEIARLIANSFGDQNKTPEARRQLVHRYGLLSVPQLTFEVRSAVSNRTKNQSTLWNALLTLGVLRDEYGPATQLWDSLDPMTRMLSSSEVYERVFAALALGSWHWREGERADRKVDDALYRDPTPRMKRDMSDSRAALVRSMTHFDAQLKKAAVLALAKRGGAKVANQVFETLGPLDPPAVPEVAWARLLAQGFLRARTDTVFTAPFRQGGSDNNMKLAAALSMSVAMLHDSPDGQPLPWVANHANLLRVLERAGIHPVDGPEVVFARGVLAWTRQLPDEWKRIWKIAVDPKSKERVAVAASQALLFCGHGWFKKDVLAWARGDGEYTLQEPVLAGFLLLAAMQGSKAGIEAAERYLKHAARRPKGDAAWDVRFHAAVGLARALAGGRITDRALRARAVGALEASLKAVHRDAPFRTALEAWLGEHADAIRGDAHFRPPEDSVRQLERSFTCPHALLSRDLVDVCVHRVNKFVLRVMNADNVQAVGGGGAEKAKTSLLFLKSYLTEYPYFSRLEFRMDRGAREPVRLAEGATGIDR